VVQATAAIRSHRDDVFDSDSEPVRQVDAWLDREAQSRLEFTGLSPDHELIAVTDVGNQLASDAVDLLTRNPGTHCIERGLLSFADHLVNGSLFRRWFVNMRRASHVRSVPVFQTTEVEHDHVALSDGVAGRLKYQHGDSLDDRGRLIPSDVDEIRAGVTSTPVNRASLAGSRHAACAGRSQPW
jgi:hypothetical protein